MNRRGVILKLTAIAILFSLTFATAVDAVIKTNRPDKEEDNYFIPKIGGMDSSSWQDDFNDESKIDPSPPGSGISDNYVVANGQVSMINTYPAWNDPSWAKMKPMILTNNEGIPLSNYPLRLTISYDPDMDPDYDDIRFKHENNVNVWLNYWIESKDVTQAIVWVKIPIVPTGQSEMYLFYDNPSASSASDFNGVFQWNAEWPDDVLITWKGDEEGAWDPDVCFDGSSEFLVCWEEGQPYWPLHGLMGFKQEIRASIYDTDGVRVVHDKRVFSDVDDGYTYFRNENPSIARGGGKWLVAWEHYQPKLLPPHNPSASTMDIKARFVQRSGSGLSLGSVIDVCTASNCQADANVEFDSVNSRFLVVWEDARDGTSDYDIRGSTYSTSGSVVVSNKLICNDVNSQTEPWAAFNPVNQQYFIVWEDGVTANNGPFRIRGGIFDLSLNPIWTGTIAEPAGYPNNDVDYNFPCVFFNSETGEYLVTWNDGDISDGDYWGNVWGKILNPAGGVVVDVFMISSGDFVRTDVNTYPISGFDDPYFVSYDDNSKIWGNLVTADGEPSSSEVLLSVGTDPLMVADWANIDVGGGKVFVAWEDIRVVYSPSAFDDFPDVFGNQFELTTQSGSSVSYSIGSEKDKILLAHVTSIQIVKSSSDFWDVFNAIGSNLGLEYNILDGDTGAILIASIEPGDLPYSLSGVTASSLRVMGTFTRSAPSYSPEIDHWSVNWIVNNPPNPPSNPDPYDGETGVDVNADLSWDCSDPDGDDLTYDVYFGTSSSPPIVSTGQEETTYDPGVMNFGITYYWKIVAFDEHGASTSGPVWSFTTFINNPPNPPSNPDPYDGETGVDVNADLSWDCSDPDGDDLTYDVYFGTFSPPPQVSWQQTGTTYNPGTLNFGQTYYWQIEAFDIHMASTPGPIWSFTTGSNDPPYVPSDPDPYDGETGVDVEADLSWTGGDPEGDTVYYDVYFDTIDPPMYLASSGQTETTYDPGTMFFDMTYYWQIVAADYPGGEHPGPVWSFTTGSNDPPYVPSDPDPYDGETGVDINADLSWTCGDPNPGDTVKYDIYFDTETPPDIFLRDHPDTTYDLQDMSYDTDYYWQIVARDSHGAETEGPIWHFTTMANPNHPPDKPGINGPGYIVRVNKEYEFTFWAFDEDEDDVYIRVSWGDEATGWLGPYASGEQITLKHTWTTPWIPYFITAHAKDINDATSIEARWPIFVITPKSVQNRGVLYNFINNFLEHRPLFLLFMRIISTRPVLTRLLLR